MLKSNLHDSRSWAQYKAPKCRLNLLDACAYQKQIRGVLQLRHPVKLPPLHHYFFGWLLRDSRSIGVTSGSASHDKPYRHKRQSAPLQPQRRSQRLAKTGSRMFLRVGWNLSRLRSSLPAQIPTKTPHRGWAYLSLVPSEKQKCYHLFIVRCGNTLVEVFYLSLTSLRDLWILHVIHS